MTEDEGALDVDTGEFSSRWIGSSCQHITTKAGVAVENRQDYSDHQADQ